MKERKNEILHIVTIIALLIFIVLGIGSTASTPSVVDEDSIETTNVSSIMIKEGKVFEVGVVPIKDFTTVGLIFVETSVTYDSNGRIIEGSEITFEMLMREAQKLSADAIINIKVDEITRYIETEHVRTVPRNNEYGTTREERVKVITKKVEYKANALAIRYTDAIIPAGR